MKSLLLLHGLNEWNGMWHALTHELKHEFWCFAPNLPGFGGEKALPGASVGPKEMAQWVLRQPWFLEHKEWWIAGHSMGGYVALELLQMAPQSMAGLCLINTTAAADDANRKLSRNRTVALLKKQPKVYFKSFAQLLFAQLPDKEKHLDALAMQAKWDQIEPEALCAVIQGLRDRDAHWLTLKNAKKPCCFFQGRKDDLIDLESFNHLHLPPDVTLKWMDGGHLLPLEKPKELGKEMMAWLACIKK